MGCNFTPSPASNQLEMWQAETFDAATIERELGWASDLGFTSIRVFVHDLLGTYDRDGFLDRFDRFLAIADRRGIGVLVVLFDRVWDPNPIWGPQPEPRPGIHNSRWVQSLGATILGDPLRHAELAPFVQGLLDRFRDDARIDGWDLFNEPDNPNPAYANQEIKKKGDRALALLRKAFVWGREVAPSQPLTVGLRRGGWHDPAVRSRTSTASAWRTPTSCLSVTTACFRRWPIASRHCDATGVRSGARSGSHAGSGAASIRILAG